MDKNEFLEKAMQANNDALQKAKLSDMLDSNSSFYVNQSDQIKKEQVNPVRMEEKDELPQIRTFDGDIHTAVHDDDLSLSKIVMSEAVRNKNTNPKEPKKWSFGTIISIFFTSMFLVGGIGAISYIFIFKNKTPVPVEVVLPKTIEIFKFDQEIEINLKNPSSRMIIEKIEQELKNPPKEDGVRRLSFFDIDDLEKNQINFKEFANIFELHTPNNLSRSFRDNFFFGINFIKGEGKPFLVLQGDYEEQIFPGMLEWEKYLTEDIGALFKVNNATSTKKIFKDKIILNNDVRILSDQQGQEGFFYSIINKLLVVFTEDVTTFGEILTRLREN